MTSSPVKKFKVSQQNAATGEWTREEPRLMLSVVDADAERAEERVQYKSLFIGLDTVLATVPCGAPDAELWARARARAGALAARSASAPALAGAGPGAAVTT